MERNRRWDLAWFLAQVALAAWLFALLRGAWRAPGAPMEEGKLLMAARLVSQGQWPHEAFEHLYGPGDVWLVGALFSIFGEGIGVERGTGAAATLVLVLSVVAIGERVQRGAGLLGGAMAAAVQIPFGIHAYSWTLALASMTAGVALLGGSADAATRWSRIRLVSSGLLCGSALVFRPDLVLALAVVGLIVHRTRSMTDGSRWTDWLVGAGLGISPWIVHLGQVGVDAVVSGVFLDPVFRLRRGRSLPLPYEFDDPAATLDRLVLAGSRPSAGVQLTMAFFAAVLAALLVGALVLWAGRRSGRAVADHRSLGAAAAVAVVILPQLLQRPDAAHLRFVVPLALGLLPAAVVLSLRDPGRRLRLAAAVGCVAIGAMLATAHSIYVEPALDLAFVAPPTVDVHHAGRRFPVADQTTAEQVTELLAAVDSLRTDDGSRLIVWSESFGRATYSEAYLYHLLPSWTPGTRFLESNPGLATASGSPLPGDVLRADLVILSTRFAGWDEPNASRDVFDDGLVAQRQLCIIESTGPYTLLEPC